MKKYRITLIHASGRNTRRIIAKNSMRAIQIALNVLPTATQFTIICRPETPCAS